ncbi:UNVERIFIED_CONTAM: Retrovirus-related Pol polyprotein from transposon RE2 [Sesamum radiatum]|uniref:Retrovirus-related Pol polyprotein from transposon RE2 n=1 Tax=Sesamum radiatum TaxID=300843 RepID=A0AAW2TI49_SESRA
MAWIFWPGIVIALRARMKLGFIDGSYVMPDRTAENYETWIRVDSKVTSGIFNAITKKISKAFLYTKTFRQLWMDLEERYGENNGPMFYQLRRVIASITQGTETEKEDNRKGSMLPLEMVSLMVPLLMVLVLGSLIQDLKTKKILAVGRVLGGLYIIDKSSFAPMFIEQILIPIQKGYKLYRLDTKAIFISRDVQFQEDVFPLANIPTDTTSYIPTPTPDISISTHPTLDPSTQHSPPNTESAPTSTLPSSPLVLRSVDHYKARLVAKGYNQIEGVDFFDSFSPVAKTVTVHIFIAIASASNWPLLQLDVNNAFLHEHLDEEVNMLPPEGYSKASDGCVCRLQRSLYGLKQASRRWNIEFNSKLESYGFHQSTHDHCLFTLKNGSVFIALLVYVDVLTGNSLDTMTKVKLFLDNLFTIKDLGHAKYFLGLELARSLHGTSITQRKYLLDIIHDCQMHGAKPTSTPLPTGYILMPLLVLFWLRLNATDDWSVDCYTWVFHALTFPLAFNS